MSRPSLLFSPLVAGLFTLGACGGSTATQTTEAGAAPDAEAHREPDAGPAAQDAGVDDANAEAEADSGPCRMSCPAHFTSVAVSGAVTIPAGEAGASDDPLASLQITFCVNEDCVEYDRAATADSRWQSLFCDAGTSCPHTYAFAATNDAALFVWLTVAGNDTYAVSADPLVFGLPLPDASPMTASVTFAFDAGSPGFSQTTSSSDCETHALACCGVYGGCSIALP